MVKKKRRKINFQKIFCFCSFIFILGCIIFYGGRFIYLYQENEKNLKTESNTFATIVMKENHEKETFKQIGQDYYFYGQVTNNYVSYSNFLWRIVKINKDNSMTLITDNIISTLAYGNKDDEYIDSSLLKWLNSNTEDNYSGKFEKILNEKEKYLINNNTCIDKISNIDNNIENISCKNIDKDGYLDLLSVSDYIYTGSGNGFINNSRYSYLANKNENNDIWYINETGKLGISDGNDILGIKVTVTLSPSVELKSGNGSIEDPYYFEETNGFIGSFVKLDNDIWRVYEENEGIVKLVLQDVIKNTDNDEEDENLKHSYSKKNYLFNNSTYGTLAYYLNKTYLNSLKYKDLIVENTYTNGFYSDDNNYKLNDIFDNTINIKISLPSIGDIIFNDKLNEYFSNTGTSNDSSSVYIQKENGIVTTKNIASKAYVVPCISIHKDKLIMGSGSNNDPYRTE